MREEDPGAREAGATIMVSLAILVGASVVFFILLIAVVTLAFYRWGDSDGENSFNKSNTIS